MIFPMKASSRMHQVGAFAAIAQLVSRCSGVCIPELMQLKGWKELHEAVVLDPEPPAEGSTCIMLVPIQRRKPGKRRFKPVHPTVMLQFTLDLSSRQLHVQNESGGGFLTVRGFLIGSSAVVPDGQKAIFDISPAEKGERIGFVTIAPIVEA